MIIYPESDTEQEWPYLRGNNGSTSGGGHIVCKEVIDMGMRPRCKLCRIEGSPRRDPRQFALSQVRDYANHYICRAPMNETPDNLKRIADKDIPRGWHMSRYPAANGWHFYCHDNGTYNSQWERTDVDTINTYGGR